MSALFFHSFIHSLTDDNTQDMSGRGRWYYPFCKRCENPYYIDSRDGPYGCCNKCSIKMRLTKQEMEYHNISYDEGSTAGRKFTQNDIETGMSDFFWKRNAKNDVRLRNYDTNTFWRDSMLVNHDRISPDHQPSTIFLEFWR